MDESHLRPLVLIIIIIMLLVGLTVSAMRQGEGSKRTHEPFASIPTVGNLAVIQKHKVPEDPLLLRIIQCESGGNPLAYNKSSGATGLGQFIPSTQEYVQKKWGMKLNFFDYEDNYYATQRLLEEEGCAHWAASAKCHKCY